jgi:hypothetical protein
MLKINLFNFLPNTNFKEISNFPIEGAEKKFISKDFLNALESI